MMNGPAIKGNPLKISISLLIISYILGEFIFPKYHLIYFFQLIGVLGLIFSVGIFISGFRLFKSYEEDPLPTTPTNRIIKTGGFCMFSGKNNDYLDDDKEASNCILDKTVST